MRTAVLAVVVASLTSTAHAGVSLLLADRGTNKIWRLTDVNNNGSIETEEIFLWYDETNASGTGLPDSINALFAAPDGTIIGGDTAVRAYYWFKDLNADGDVLDAGESRLLSDVSNASGASTAAPSGGSFMPSGDVLVVNSSNASGCDAVYRCRDVNADGNWQGPGEMSAWVADSPVAFVSCGGPFSPQEIVVDGAGVGYLRNSSSGLFGVYRIEDLNGNGRADDDTMEFRRWYTGTNAGLILEKDQARPGSLYYTNLASGGVDQILRLADTSADGDADDAGEAVMVFSTGEANFGISDVLSLPNGDLLLSDNTGKRIVHLHDVDNDGLFSTPGERANLLVATGTGIDDLRQMALLPSTPVCGTADYNGDGDIGTDQDIEAFFACLGGTCCASCFPGGSDFNADGDAGTDQDIESFFRVLGGGPC
ncbi:MAG TPA: hypothetical protein VD997_05470 [Phycisphaerales bacterium]|nr:hypothetical protein [Phycisphaerales bacterium]